MKKIIITTIIITSFLTNFAQNTYNDTHDPKAKAILDKLAENLKGKNIRFYFFYNLYNAQDSSNIEYYGYLFVKGNDKYKIIIPDAEIFSDGTKNYSYNKKSNEINITSADPNNNLIFTPTKIINAYKKGYKYRLRGEITLNAKIKTKDGKIKTKQKNCNIIDIYPENIKKSNFSIIRLWIDKSNNDLISIKYQLNNGIEEVIELLNFNIGVKINDEIFKFNANKYPKNIDIIDFTED